MAPHAHICAAASRWATFEFVDTMIKDGLWDAFNGYHMGNTAENVAKQYQITRAQQDEFAVALAEQGRGRAEGRQVQGRDRPGHHQGPQGRHHRRYATNIRARRHLEAMAKLRPAFEKDGTVTAGNASGINDGAAAVVLMTAKQAAKAGKTPLARIVSWAPGRRRSRRSWAPARSRPRAPR